MDMHACMHVSCIYIEKVIEREGRIPTPLGVGVEAEDRGDSVEGEGSYLFDPHKRYIDYLSRLLYPYVYRHVHTHTHVDIDDRGESWQVAPLACSTPNMQHL